MDSNEKMLAVKEAAAMLGVSCDSVRRWIRDGELEAWSFPRRSSGRKRVYTVWRIAEEEVRRFIHRQCLMKAVRRLVG